MDSVFQPGHDVYLLPCLTRLNGQSLVVPVKDLHGLREGLLSHRRFRLGRRALQFVFKRFQFVSHSAILSVFSVWRRNCLRTWCSRHETVASLTPRILPASPCRRPSASTRITVVRSSSLNWPSTCCSQTESSPLVPIWAVAKTVLLGEFLLVAAAGCVAAHGVPRRVHHHPVKPGGESTLPAVGSKPGHQPHANILRQILGLHPVAEHAPPDAVRSGRSGVPAGPKRRSGLQRQPCEPVFHPPGQSLIGNNSLRRVRSVSEQFFGMDQPPRRRRNSGPNH